MERKNAMIPMASAPVRTKGTSHGPVALPVEEEEERRGRRGVRVSVLRSRSVRVESERAVSTPRA
jgi:hypothetical protein